MRDDNTLEILKSAILLERRGKAFYANVAEGAEDPAVKEFFAMMADEEAQHAAILGRQFSAYLKDQKFSAGSFDGASASAVSSRILTEDIKNKISAAGFEAAAISAAMAMEAEAVKLYAARAQQTDDPEEQALYRWLADWESGHLDFLAQIDRDLKQSVWADNQFWPF